MKNKIKTTLLALAICSTGIASDYKIDTPGMHAAVMFKISHLNTSWLRGRFDKFDGKFSYDADKPNDSKITMTVDTTSVNSNHAERDIHIQSDGYLNTDKFPKATFTSTQFNLDEQSNGTVKGILELHGVKKEVEMAITKVGEGKDPWGGYRVGFDGVMTITMADFGISKYAGTPSGTLELTVSIEGKRQK